MTSRVRPKPSIDFTIIDIPEGNSSIRIISSVVVCSGNFLILNDGTSQITIALGPYHCSQFSIGKLYRFIISITKLEDKIEGILISYNSITKNQAQRYKRLVRLEKRNQK